MLSSRTSTHIKGLASSVSLLFTLFFWYPFESLTEWSLSPKETKKSTYFLSINFRVLCPRRSNFVCTCLKILECIGFLFRLIWLNYLSNRFPFQDLVESACHNRWLMCWSQGHIHQWMWRLFVHMIPEQEGRCDIMKRLWYKMLNK